MAVTQAQIAAGKAANTAYKAAQSSGNSSAAKNIVSNAAKALGVSSSSSTYKNIYSQASNIKATTTTSVNNNVNNGLYNPNNITNLPTYNLGNLGNNPYGDVRVGAQGRQTYTGEGIKLSTGDVIKDKSVIPEVSNLNDYLKFGQDAEKIETIEPGFLEKRNDAIIMDLYKNTPKITQENVDRLLIDYIKAKDPEGKFQTGSQGEKDIMNTIESIKSRMGAIPTEAEYQQKDLTDKATNAYDREITDIKSQYAAEESAFMKAGAIEDRYTNFNEVNNKIQSTLEAAGKHRAENLYTGMPTDEQIGEIAQGLGQDFNTTKKILEGRGYEDLEMQGDFKEQSERPYQRKFDDLELDRNRMLTDVETKHQRTQTALNEQIDDVKTQMERTLAVGEKAGALSGAIRSSGYVQGLNNIRQDAIKNMDRLNVRKDWDTEDTAMNKGRVIEDFNTNMTRAKQDLETTLNDIKTTNGAALGQYLNEYAPSSSELTRKLNELEDKFAIKSQQAFQMYIQNLRGITDTMTYDTEKALQLEGMKQQLQQTNVNNLLANNGMALAGISYGDLTTMLQSGDISPTDYTAMAGSMKTLGISSLQSMGVPTPQDFALYNQMLEQGMTPQQAIASITSSNPSRYSLSGGGGSDWKYDENSGQYMRTNAAGQLEFSSSPSAFGEQEAPTNYTPADNSQIQEGGVFLYNYKDGDNAPRNGWCGQFVNDYIKSMGITNENLFIDPIKDKARYVNSQIPTKGSVMIMDSKTSPDNGHVAIVESVNTDGTLNLKEANWNGDGKIHIRKNVDPNNMGVKVHGYFNPTKQGVSQGGTSQQSQGKDTYLALVSKGGLTKNDQEAIAKKAIREGWADEFNEALKQGAIVDLSPTQITQYNKEYDRFIGNAVVKGFEEGLTQFESLAYALSDKSGPGDMAGVFAFMKTLDPSSVVRETEFDSAANSAGVASKIKNIYARLSSGKVLTPEQAEVFKKVATKFIEAKGQSYDRLYNNMSNSYTQFGIPKELLPLKATDQLKEFINGGLGAGTSGQNNDPLGIR